MTSLGSSQNIFILFFGGSDAFSWSWKAEGLLRRIKAATMAGKLGREAGPRRLTKKIRDLNSEISTSARTWDWQLGKGNPENYQVQDHLQLKGWRLQNATHDNRVSESDDHPKVIYAYQNRKGNKQFCFAGTKCANCTQNSSGRSAADCDPQAWDWFATYFFWFWWGRTCRRHANIYIV